MVIIPLHKANGKMVGRQFCRYGAPRTLLSDNGPSLGVVRSQLCAVNGELNKYLFLHTIHKAIGLKG